MSLRATKCLHLWVRLMHSNASRRPNNSVNIILALNYVYDAMTVFEHHSTTPDIETTRACAQAAMATARFGRQSKVAS